MSRAEASRKNAIKARAARVPKFNEERRAAFFNNLAEHGEYSIACLAGGISRGYCHQLRKHEDGFQELCDEALAKFEAKIMAAAEELALKGHEEPIYQNGVLVGTKYRKSEAMLKAYMKRHNKAFRDKVEVEGTVQHVHTHRVEIAALPEDTQRKARAFLESFRAESGDGGEDVKAIDVEVVED